RRSWFENEQKIFESIWRIVAALESLSALGFKASPHAHSPEDDEIADRAASFVADIIFSGEELLLHHKRLAQSDASYGFLHSNDLMEHWDRYKAAGRIPFEIHQLVIDTRELLRGYEAIMHEDDRLLAL